MPLRPQVFDVDFGLIGVVEGDGTAARATAVVVVGSQEGGGSVGLIWVWMLGIGMLQEALGWRMLCTKPLLHSDWSNRAVRHFYPRR